MPGSPEKQVEIGSVCSNILSSYSTLQISMSPHTTAQNLADIFQ